MEITIKAPKTERVLTVELDEALYDNASEDIRRSLGLRMLCTDVKNKARAMMNDAETPLETVEAMIADYVPGVSAPRGPRKVTVAQAEAALSNMSPEEVARLLEKAKALLGE